MPVKHSNSSKKNIVDHDFFYYTYTIQRHSRTEKIKFSEEIKAVKAESKKLADEGVDIIVVLSHCGTAVDYEVARRGGKYIDIIVGGHSHSLFHNGDDIPMGFVNSGDYPAVVMQKEHNNRTVLIVQAAAYSLYVGALTVKFDSHGEVVSWNGNTHLLDGRQGKCRLWKFKEIY